MEHVEPAHGLTVQLLLFLAATSLVVPALRAMRLSAVMGFLAIGVMLGPFGLGQWGGVFPWLGELRLDESAETRWLAELGVVFLLFAIGLEVSAERLIALRRLVIGLGALQVATAAIAITAIALAFGNNFPAAAVIGLAFALSSTAVVLQILAERRALSGEVGRAAFSVLLLQDLAVVPILAVVSALGVSGFGAIGGAQGVATAIASALGAIAVILVAGRFLARPLFRLAASTGSREVFVAAALLVVIAAATAAEAAGLSMALGAFLAGLLLAGTEFRHQIEADVEPFKGLLLGLFFVTVGMQIDIAYLAAEPLRVLLGVVGLALLKAALLIPLARSFGFRWPQAVELGFLLSQGGEFGFVVIALAQTEGVIPGETASYMLLVVALSLFLTPVVATLGAAAARALERWRAEAPAPPIEAPSGHVVIAGFGRVGQTLAEILAEEEIPHVALDADAEKVAAFKERRWPVHFGDASRRDVLGAVGAEHASAIVVTIDDAVAAMRVVSEARAAWPHVPVYVRARDPEQAKALHALGAALASPETTEATLQLGEALLNGLGVPDETAKRIIDDRRAREVARALAQT